MGGVWKVSCLIDTVMGGGVRGEGGAAIIVELVQDLIHNMGRHVVKKVQTIEEKIRPLTTP